MCWTLYLDPSGTEWRYGTAVATLSPSMIYTSGIVCQSVSVSRSEWRYGIDAAILLPAYFLDVAICVMCLVYNIEFVRLR